MKKKSKVSSRNQSKTGWWLYREIEKWTSDRQKVSSPNSRYVTWENTRIIKAKNRDEAYAKAMRLGRAYSPSRTIGGQWTFAGISQLLPIYEELEDGAEIMWDELGKLTQKKIDILVKSKEELSVFDDTEE